MKLRIWHIDATTARFLNLEGRSELLTVQIEGITFRMWLREDGHPPFDPSSRAIPGLCSKELTEGEAFHFAQLFSKGIEDETEFGNLEVNEDRLRLFFETFEIPLDPYTNTGAEKLYQLLLPSSVICSKVIGCHPRWLANELHPWPMGELAEAIEEQDEVKQYVWRFGIRRVQHLYRSGYAACDAERSQASPYQPGPITAIEAGLLPLSVRKRLQHQHPKRRCELARMLFKHFYRKGEKLQHAYLDLVHLESAYRHEAGLKWIKQHSGMHYWQYSEGYGQTLCQQFPASEFWINSGIGSVKRAARALHAGLSYDKVRICFHYGIDQFREWEKEADTQSRQALEYKWLLAELGVEEEQVAQTS